jgi:hypothetical protein
VAPVIRESVVGSASGANVTVTTSANVAVGDLLICFHGNEWGTQVGMTTPTGTSGTWTLQASDNRGATQDNAHLKVWTRLVTAGGAQTVTCNTHGGADVFVRVVVVRGDTLHSSWFDGAAGGGNGGGTGTDTAHICPSVTVAGSDDLLICAALAASGGAVNYSAPSGMSALAEVDTSYGTLGTFTQELSSSGATGTRTATASVARIWATASIAIRGATQAERRNMITNPSFETGVSGWSASGGNPAGPAEALQREQAPYGPRAGSWYAFTRRSVAGDVRVFPSSRVPVTAGQTWAGSIWVNRDGSGAIGVDLAWHDANGEWISSATGTASPTSGTWQRISVIGTAPAGATSVLLYTRFTSQPANNFVRVDAVMLEQADSVGTYFDGSFSGYEWEGTPHGSVSRTVGTGSSDAVWKADLTKADVVLAGYKDDAWQRQMAGGVYNDPAVGPWPIAVTSAPGGRPGGAVPFAVPTNATRYEVVPNHQQFEDGDEFYFGTAFYLSADYPVNATSWNIIEQMHGAPGTGSPVIAFEIRGGGLRISGGANRPGASTPGQYAYDIQIASNIQRQRWYSLVYRIQFSDQPSGGRLDVWLNDEQILSDFAPPCGTVYTTDIHAEGGPSYRKQGIYRSSDVTAACTMWQAGQALGTTYASVNPTVELDIDLRSGYGWASTGMGSHVSGTKTTASVGRAHMRLRGRAAGPKITWSTGYARALLLGGRAFGLKTGIGPGRSNPIYLGAYGHAPIPIPVFTGRPLPEEPLPMAQTRYLVQNILTGKWLHTDLPLSEDQVTITLSGPCEISGKLTPEMADLKSEDGKPLLRSWGHVVYLEMDGEIRAAGLVNEDSYDDQTQTLHCIGVSAYPKIIPYLDNYSKYNVDPVQVVVDMWDYVQKFRNGNIGVTVERMGDSGVRFGTSTKEGTKKLADLGPKVQVVEPPVGSADRPVWDRLRALGFNGPADDNISAVFPAKSVLDKVKQDVANNVPLGPKEHKVIVRQTDVSAAVWQRLLDYGHLDDNRDNDVRLTPTQELVDRAYAEVKQAESGDIEPYVINWWDVKSCGDVIDDAIKACPADYIEQYRWNTPRTFVYQSILVAQPRLGRRREDLRFVTGENIVEPPEMAADYDGFATMVIGIGAGEGSAALRETAEIVAPGVLRKPYVYRNSKITDREELKRIVAQQLTLRSTFDGQEITRIVVTASHDNAKFGAYNVGDDIYVQVQVPHWGWVQQWGRIISMTLAREDDLVELQLRRSDSFYYGREIESS